MKSAKMSTIVFLALGLMVCAAKVSEAAPMGTAWTYQGRLMDANSVAEGQYDFEFKLYDDVNTITGNQQGSTIDINDLDVIDGYFTVELDFGSSVFDGNSVWLEIDVRPGDSNDPNDFVVLSPRQEITPTPYALQTRGIFVDNVLNVGIGTTSPVGKLHVDGGKAMDGTWGADVVIKAQDGGDGWEMQYNGVDGGDIILLPGEGGEEYGAGFPGPDGKVGIGTTIPVGQLGLGEYQGGTVGSAVAGHDKQLVLGGEYNTGFNTGSSVKLLISDYDNDTGADIYPIYCEDKQNRVDFYVRKQEGAVSTAYFGGKVGIGTKNPGTTKLFVQMPSSIPPFYYFQDGLIIKNGERCIGNPLEVQDSSGNIDFVVTINRVGIGTPSPDSRLHVVAEGEVGLHVVAEDGVGIHGVSDTADGIFGQNTGGSGRSGVYGETNATNNYGVFGRNNAQFTITSGFLGGPNHGVSGHHEDGLTGAWTYGYLAGEYCAVYGEASGAEAVAARFVGDVQVMSKGETSARLTTPTLEITGGADLSEQFEIRGISADIQPSAGLVVSIDPESPGDLVVSNTAYDRRVAGIISGAGGLSPGVLMGQEGSKADGKNPVALTGRVYCRADASKGSIEPGDLLTTSDTAGHAMKVNDYELAQGAILGKAMSALEEGQGLVLVLVTLQ